MLKQTWAFNLSLQNEWRKKRIIWFSLKTKCLLRHESAAGIKPSVTYERLLRGGQDYCHTPIPKATHTRAKGRNKASIHHTDRCGHPHHRTSSSTRKENTDIWPHRDMGEPWELCPKGNGLVTQDRYCPGPSCEVCAAVRFTNRVVGVRAEWGWGTRKGMSLATVSVL